MFNFITSASSASWYGGVRTFISGDVAELTFGNGYAESGRNGYVQNSIMVGGDTEDGGEERYLHTHPASGRNGKIVGIFPEYQIRAGDRFTSQIGFNEGATGTDGVTFVVGVISEGRSVSDVNDFFSSESSIANALSDNYVELHRTTKRYDETLQSLDVDLSGFANQRIRFVLSVEAGLSSGQDWAVWVKPKVSSMATITIRNLFCITESTSGWSARRRRLRRERYSDEVGFMIMMQGIDNRGNFTSPFMVELRAMRNVDSGERKDFIVPVDFKISLGEETTNVLIWVQALEIDGVGDTINLAEAAFNTWKGYMFFHPNNDTSDSAHYSFTRYSDRSGNDHNVLFEDYWVVPLNNLLSGGIEPSIVSYAGQQAGDPSDVSTYLNANGITRSVNLNRSTDMSVETRRYNNSRELSDYSFDIIYR